MIIMPKKGKTPERPISRDRRPPTKIPGLISEEEYLRREGFTKEEARRLADPRIPEAKREIKIRETKEERIKLSRQSMKEANAEIENSNTRMQNAGFEFHCGSRPVEERIMGERVEFPGDYVFGVPFSRKECIVGLLDAESFGFRASRGRQQYSKYVSAFVKSLQSSKNLPPPTRKRIFSELMNKLNLYGIKNSLKSATAAFAFVEKLPRGGAKVTLADAGHKYAYVCRNNGKVETVGRKAGGTVLGYMPDELLFSPSRAYPLRTFEMNPRDTLVIMSDGLILPETKVRGGEWENYLKAVEGHEKEMKKIMSRASALAPKELSAGLYKQLTHFVWEYFRRRKEPPRFVDDTSVVIFKV